MSSKTMRRMELARPVRKALKEFKVRRSYGNGAGKGDFTVFLKDHDPEGEFNASNVFDSLKRTGRITETEVIV